MTEAQCTRLAEDLLRKHNLYQKGWRFEFGRGKSCFGYCSYKEKVISISRHFIELNPVEEIRNTILHEIAHALSPVRGHGIEWKRKCLEVGARPERCWSSKRVVAPPARFIGTCPRCERQIRRHRRKHISCGRCDKKFNKDLLLQWRELDHEEMQPQTPFVAVDL